MAYVHPSGRPWTNEDHLTMIRTYNGKSTIENHGFNDGRILYEYEDELDTTVKIDVTFSIAGADRKGFLVDLMALTDEYRI